MYSFQALDKLEETFPELDDIHSTTWWRFRLEVFLQRTFVGKFKNNIGSVAMDIATIKFYDAVCVSYAPETIHFLCVLIFAFFRRITFQDKSICVGIIHLLAASAGEDV
jgi:hypothetical protein